MTFDPFGGGLPSEKQSAFLKSATKWIAYGGARGGGKSWAVRTKAKLLALAYAGIRILIVRRTYPELINNHVSILRPELVGIASYVDKDKIFKFVNGSTISLAYCDADKDLDRLQGVEYDVIFIDEATQLSEYQIKAIAACIRGVNDHPKRMYLTCNPGGQSHGYIKRLFVDKVYQDGERPDDYTFIPALVQDNPALMEAQPDYIRQLEVLPPKLRDAWLYGKWDVYEGQFFEEFSDRPEHYKDRTHTHVIDAFEIDDSFKLYRSFDWGYSRPFSCGWWAIDTDGVAYRILEMYGCTQTPNEGVKWTPDHVFDEIHRIETEHRWLRGRQITGVADPAIWSAETGESIAEVAARHGVYFVKGDHERLAGWMQVHYRMAFDDCGRAMMYVFRNCKAFIRTMPLLMYDEHKPEDLDTDGEDHVADEVRYFCMARPIKPRMAQTPDTYSTTTPYIFLDIPKSEIMPKPVMGRMERLDG